jgi:sugar/nucleoside kinase (ribokinase family)
VGKIGRDRFGDLAEADLQAEGVDAHLVTTDAHLTGSVAVWIDDQGQRSMVSGKGADHYLLPSELPHALLAGSEHVHLTAWSFFADPPRSAARRAAEIAKAGGARVSLDPGSFQMIEEMGVGSFLQVTRDLGVDLLLPNYEEGVVLSGEHDPEAIARVLAERYPGALIALKLDAKGALLFDGARAIAIAPHSNNLVDATGAGDAFAGAFLSRWLRGATPTDAARFATRVSEWVIERVGARTRPDAALLRLLA